MTLIAFVVLYLLASIAIGLYAATRVKNTSDYAVAGRSLPLAVIIATTFATWFGSETVLGIPSKFVEGGLQKTVEDPIGAGMCLVLVGMFFARKLYKMDLLTIGDFYRKRYGKGVEIFSSVVILVSYLGWVAAQITALGLVFNLLSVGAISVATGMVIGTLVVLVYTLFGGMWSVALTDFFQMIIIVVGLTLIAVFAADHAGGVGKVVEYAQARDLFQFFPDGGLHGWLFWLGAAITIMIGSIPQQDVFQRVMSAKSADIAVKGPIIGGISYMLFAGVPMFIGLSAFLIMPDAANALLKEDSQKILPTLVMEHMPVWLQVFFFGALLSAIMSTASATLLAPSTTFVENVLKNFVKLSDHQSLRYMRVTVVVFTACVLALLDRHGRHADLRTGVQGLPVPRGGRVLAAGVRAVLEAIDAPGRDLVDRARHEHLGAARLHAARRGLPVGARRVPAGSGRHVRRLAGADGGQPRLPRAHRPARRALARASLIRPAGGCNPTRQPEPPRWASWTNSAAKPESLRSRCTRCSMDALLTSCAISSALSRRNASARARWSAFEGRASSRK